MGNLGVFRDDFYNAIHVLPAAQANAFNATATVTASALASAVENVLVVGTGQSTAQTYTTDTAVNIIANLQAAVAAAYKANVGGFASSLGAVPPLGVPNLFNVSFVLTINNLGTTVTSTLAAGTGVTLAALGSLSAANLVASTLSRYVVTITSANTVTITRVQ